MALVSERACRCDCVKVSGGALRGFADQFSMSDDFVISMAGRMGVVEVEGGDGILDDFSGGGQGGGVLRGRE